MLPVQTQAQMRIVMTNDNTADFAIDEIRIFLLLISKYLWLRINHISSVRKRTISYQM